ncbi:archaeal ATPase [Pontibacterium granulatum]|uniref:archaeal ATPase n=1 Tax=Pontibacterium granulatum TaxID=2036029 RepID=UPI00249CC282|nr:archaeal ATPase [Pontibacterium granulatum]MDI3324873.1 archaeal ATPase [Pontibacterium granulatum]
MVAENKVIIDLNKPNLPGSIDTVEFVQQTLKERLISDIELVATPRENHSPVYGVISEVGRQVFFIDGTRGAGKTTFMNGIVQHFKDSNNVHALRCIDPTKLPRIEPILVTVLAQLNTDVSDKLRKNSGWSIENNKEKENWQNSLKNISQAIKLLDKKEYSKDFFDEALELNALLSNASGGLGLEEQFSKLLEQACDILGRNAILVAFDDIDTQFNTGWNVLEAVRKYFNSPRLIVLMTGDLRLYSQLIRGKQYANYDAEMLSEEASGTEKRNRSVMVNHLEQQYLIKLLPVHRRINLKSLYQLVDDKNNDWPISVVTRKGGGSMPLELAVNEMLENGLHLKQSADLKLYANEILKQPVRLVVQLLQRYYQQMEIGSNKNLTDLFNEAIRGTMLGNIYKAGLTYDNSDAHVGIIAKDIFNYTLMDGDSNTGFYLRPQSESEVLRSSSIYLASMVSKATEGSLWGTLHLMLAGCGSVTLYDRLLQDNRHKLSTDQIEEACKTYLGLGRSESLMHWANRGNAALCPINQDGVRGVHVGLLRLNRSTPDNPIAGTVAYDSSKETSFLAKLAVDIASSDLAGRSMHFFISIPNLLGGISDLIEGFGSSDISDDGLKALLAKLAFRTTCSAPPWASYEKTSAAHSDDDSAEINEPVLEIDTESSAQISIIKTWLQLVQDLDGGIKSNSVLIGKIWTRLYFNLANIAEEHRKNIGGRGGLAGKSSKATNAAKIMRFNVVAVLHAALFEEDFHHHTGYSTIFTEIWEKKNPVTTIDLFADKLEKLKANDEGLKDIGKRFPIFYLLVTCPLLHPFMFADGSRLSNKLTDKKESSFEDIIKEIVAGVYKDYDVYKHRLTHFKRASITASKSKLKSGDAQGSESTVDKAE